MTYVPEPIPSRIIYDKLEAKWDSHSGNVPKPRIMEGNAHPDTILEVPSGLGGHTDSIIIIKPEITGEKETLRDLGATVKDVSFSVVIEIHTKKNRQRLYDLKAEVRRIIHAHMHDWDGSYDVCWYRGFTEMVNTLNYWNGMVRCEFQTSKAAIDV